MNVIATQAGMSGLEALDDPLPQITLDSITHPLSAVF
jgi:hypothetical protein